MKAKKIICGLLCGGMLMSMASCSAFLGKSVDTSPAPVLKTQSNDTVSTPAGASEKNEAAKPKYVFLFIGDGMSYPQFQAASDYLGAIADDDYENALPSVELADRGGAVLDGPVKLNFMDFEVAGSAVTFDSCSFAPDSASTATSIAIGKKTYSGMINVDITGATPYETIS